MEEVRVSAIVSKRGYINICDQRTKVRLMRVVAFDDKMLFWMYELLFF